MEQEKIENLSDYLEFFKENLTRSDRYTLAATLDLSFGTINNYLDSKNKEGSQFTADAILHAAKKLLLTRGVCKS